jgi:hypothetical protein
MASVRPGISIGRRSTTACCRSQSRQRDASGLSSAESFEACPRPRKHLGLTLRGAMNGIERVMLFRHNRETLGLAGKRGCSLFRIQCAPLRRSAIHQSHTPTRKICGATVVTGRILEDKENKKELTQAACRVVSDRSRSIRAAAPSVIGAFSV